MLVILYEAKVGKRLQVVSFHGRFVRDLKLFSAHIDFPRQFVDAQKRAVAGKSYNDVLRNVKQLNK